LSSKKSQFDGLFRSWDLGARYGTSADGKYQIRIEGFWFAFDDGYGSPKFLAGFSFWERRAIWKEYRTEIKRRALEFIAKDRDERLKQLFAEVDAILDGNHEGTEQAAARAERNRIRLIG
jgi:hypothetical protein